jgi:hypothetical protein
MFGNNFSILRENEKTKREGILGGVKRENPCATRPGSTRDENQN